MGMIFIRSSIFDWQITTISKPSSTNPLLRVSCIIHHLVSCPFTRQTKKTIVRRGAEYHIECFAKHLIFT